MPSIPHAFGRRSLSALLFSSLALSACGGGGGAGPEGAAVSAPPAAAAAAPASAFRNLAVPAGFSWSTVNEIAGSSLLLRRAAGDVGAVRLVVSNFIDTDPTGSGDAMEPMSTDVIATLLTPAASPPTVRVTLPDLRLPAATTEVWLEVFATPGSQRLASRRLRLADIAAGTAQVDL